MPGLLSWSWSTIFPILISILSLPFPPISHLPPAPHAELSASEAIDSPMVSLSSPWQLPVAIQLHEMVFHHLWYWFRQLKAPLGYERLYVKKGPSLKAGPELCWQICSSGLRCEHMCWVWDNSENWVPMQSFFFFFPITWCNCRCISPPALELQLTGLVLHQISKTGSDATSDCSKHTWKTSHP